MAVTVRYFSEASNGSYSGGALTYIGAAKWRNSILSVAQAWGVSAGAIAGAMAEENNSYLQSPLAHDALDYYGEHASDWRVFDNSVPLPGIVRTHQQWINDYGAVGGDSDKYQATPRNKRLHPVLIDYGPANIKLATAIGLIRRYQENFANDDVLSLGQYFSDYAKLVRDIIDPQSDVTVKLFALMIREAQDWFESKNAYGSDWTNLPQAFKDALYISYVNFGRALIQKKFDDLPAGALYEPTPGAAGGAGINHLANASAIGSALGLQTYGDDVSTASLGTLVSAAQEDSPEGLAHRYALVRLRPVVLLGLDYVSRNPGGILDVYDPNTGSGALTVRWIEDRAKFVDWKSRIDATDKKFGIDASAGANVWFEDFGSKEKTFVLTADNPSLDNPKAVEDFLRTAGARRFLFAADAGSALNGNSLADALYGGVGADQLSGQAGNDYLQGGGGIDNLRGGTGDDELVGGKGDDVLDGGVGNDTYRWSKLDGFDTIIDAREGGTKAGSILFLGQSLAGLKTQVSADNPGLFTDGRGIRYAFTGTPGVDGLLTVVKPGEQGGLRLTAFRSGDFGIIIPPATPINKTSKFGTSDNDNNLEADAADQKVFGLAGNDRIRTAYANTEAYGGAGHDLLLMTGKGYGDDGRDIIIAADGNDELYGGADSDALRGGGDDDYLEGNDGGDILVGGSGSDVIYGGTGNDFISGGGILALNNWDEEIGPEFGTITVNGVTGIWGVVSVENMLDADDGADFIDGGDGIDTIFAGSGDDFARGGAGDDLVVGLAGSDFLEGNDGNDTLYGDATEGNLNVAGQPFYTLPMFHGADVLWGGAGNDTLLGDGGADELYGEGDDDTLIGDAAGLDEAFHGEDYLDGGDGNDTMYGEGKNDTLFGGAGNDWMEGDSLGVAFDKHGDDYLDGGAGDDHVQGDGGNDTLFGGDGADQLFGDTDNTPLANQGDDYLDGEGGNDYLRGHGGDDTLFGGGGDDQLLGDGGDDYLDGEDGADLMSGGEGNDEVYGRLGNDDLKGDGGDDYIDAGEGNDLLFGGSGSDHLIGGLGVDQLSGNDGDDLLDGGDGNDTLFGDAGNDVLFGGAGGDVFVGGAGDDFFMAALGEGDGIVDTEGANTLQLAYGGEVSALTVLQAFDPAGVSYMVLMDAGGNYIQIQNGFAGAISSFDFGGNVLTRQQLMAQAQVGPLVLTGGAGVQHFVASGNADEMNGGAGADVMEGLAGDDIYFVDDAADIVIENAGEGADTVKSSATHTLAANVENLELTGTSAIDGTGNASNNIIIGNAAANTLDGGAGNDTLNGGFGGDTYHFGRGYGNDRIQESDNGSSPVDRVVFAADTLPADVAVTRSGNDLVLSITGTTDVLTVAGYFTTPFSVVEEFRFDGGVVWDQMTIAQKLSAGTPGDDTLTGTNGNDILNGLGGNDILFGQAGDDRLFGETGIDNLIGDEGADVLDGGVDNDTLQGGTGGDVYVFRRGDGADTVFETDDGTNPVDRIEFAADILPADVTARRNSSNLVLTVGGGGSITVNGYFSNDAVGSQVVEEVRLGDGTIWDVAAIKALVLVPTAGADNLIGYASDDVLSGLGGNDTLSGGGGNDTYHYLLGGGFDTINNNDASAATTDRLVFGPGIMPANLRLTRAGTSPDNLSIQLTQGQSTSTVVQINGYFNAPSGGELDEIRFADAPSTVWNVATVRAMLLAATEGFDTILGFETDDVIDGLGGNDSIRGLSGNDTLSGGAGNDTLAGGAGVDVLSGGAGDDILYGEELSPDLGSQSGADTLDGGAGRDQLFGRRGNDIYVFDRGYGHETIDESSISDGFDTLRLKAGVLPTDVVLIRHGNDLVVTIAGDQAQAWVAQYFSPTLTNKPIEQIVFNDGTTWDAAAIATRVVAGAQNTQTGTAGNDLFIVDNVDDVINEAAGQGTDTVQSSVSYGVPLNVENITLTGTLDLFAVGNAQSNVITGNSGDNSLLGNDGNDTLNGGLGNDLLNGGAGADTLNGGQGDDSYLVDNAGDNVSEAAGQGIDTVTASYGFSNYTIGANIENLIVQTQFNFVVTITGNELDNVITGRNALNDVYDGGAGADTIIAPGGTFTVDNAGDRVIASGSAYIKSKVDWTLASGGTDVELLVGTAATNATGNAGNNFLMGNERANVLSGLDGNDTIFSGCDGSVFLGDETGTDTLIGGRGDDVYILADSRFVQTNGTIIYNNAPGSINHDLVVENAGEGTDTVRSLYDYALGDNVENLELLAYTFSTPPLAPVHATGNALANRITGNLADNIIDGGAGADTMIGGQGNDTYYVDDINDVVTESAGQGSADHVISQTSYTLGDQIENLTLAGSGAISGTGNALANRIDGSQNSAGNVLTGGAGNDTYIVGGGDTIVENAGEGVDTVQSDVSFTIGANVENLVLTGTAATTGTGDALANTIDGSQNSAVNTLVGGAGDDTYIVDSGDVIVENAGEGFDTVTAAFDYTLGANVENLVLAGSAVSGTGSADANTITGNSLDNVIDGGGGTDSMIGGFGNDTYHVDEAGDAITELAGEGVDTVVSSISYTLGDELENLTLAGSDAISGTGNAFDNTLDGSQNAAANVLTGGLGNDTYVVGDGDTIVEDAGQGIDTIRSSVSYVLGAELENLELMGAAAINGTGNALGNWMTGNGAANILDGGAGNDVLVGGLGDDTYRYTPGASSDVVFDEGGALDTIELGAGIAPANVTGSRVNDDLVLAFAGSSGTLTLSEFYVSSDNEFERVLFSDGTVWDVNALKGTVAIIGNNSANTLNGTSGDDRIFGLGGNDTLNGNAGNDFLDGGTGTDTMVGGQGDDTYVVDVAADITTEGANAGIDTIQTSITLSLASTSPTRANIENLTLTGTGNINATGNTLANRLTGNSGNNTLDGGTGIDTMLGGLGNDLYIVDVAGDVTTENVNEGIDTIQTGITLSLATRDNIENLTLTGSSGINATGNALDNVLTGNTGANRLEGGAGNDTLNGGTGIDTMLGGSGNDLYIVDVSGDVTTENANEGIDTIQTGITFSLNSAGRNNIENLTLTGTGAINATGNALNNILTGTSGNNTLTGLAGNDIYFLNGGTDTVVEAANEGEDTINSTIAITALAANVENLILTGTNAINGTGNGLNNLLRGNSAVNTLAGVLGNDILEGGDGNDILGDTGGKNLFNGQVGNDTLNGNTGNELLIGGAGTDTINTSSGADIIGFNRGDGVDTVAVSTVKDNSVSLGGGIRYADLFLTKSGNNLILKTNGTGTTEQMTFTNWYSAAANRSVLNLQVVVEASADYNAGSGDALLNKKVARFNFDALVNAFDAALVANPGLTNWALTNALLSAHLAGSDGDALGGDLAYRYGLQNNLAAVGSIGAQNVLGAAQFGSGTQAFQAQPALESGALRLT